MIKKLSITLVILLFGAVSAFAGDVNMKPGEWEITTTIEMKGMSMKMPPSTHTQCITKEDIVPKNTQGQSDECTIKNTKVSGDTVSWEMVCSGERGSTSGKGTITYSGTTFKGEMMINMPNNMSMKNTMTGKRIGDCKK